MNGICTLANDCVYDQLIALLNSISAVIGPDIPVCIYPFDDQLDRIRAEIQNRPNVMIYDDQQSIQTWDKFMAQASPASIKKGYRIYGGHRRFCAFDAPFDRFIYMDADTVLLSTPDLIWQQLEHWDCITYDFQFLHPDKVYNVNSSKLLQVFSQERLEKEIFCSGFFASKRGLFDPDKQQWLLDCLKNGESEILYPTGDQPVLNYMFMRSQAKICNFAHWLPKEQRTGSAINSSHFERVGNGLHDRGTPLTYLHYIGIPPNVMEAVCNGQSLDFPYRDIFLHYRYLHEPEKMPEFELPLRRFDEYSPPPLHQRIFNKIRQLVP